jgi:aspartyl aminopeptidase
MMYVTAEDAAKLIGCDKSTIHTYQSRNKLNVYGKLFKIVNWGDKKRKMAVNLYNKEEVMKLCQK